MTPSTRYIHCVSINLCWSHDGPLRNQYPYGIVVLWFVTPCSLVGYYQRRSVAHCPSLTYTNLVVPYQNDISTLKWEAQFSPYRWFIKKKINSHKYAAFNPTYFTCTHKSYLLFYDAPTINLDPYNPSSGTTCEKEYYLWYILSMTDTLKGKIQFYQLKSC